MRGVSRDFRALNLRLLKSTLLILCLPRGIRTRDNSFWQRLRFISHAKLPWKSFGGRRRNYFFSVYRFTAVNRNRLRKIISVTVGTSLIRIQRSTR